MNALKVGDRVFLIETTHKGEKARVEGTLRKVDGLPFGRVEVETDAGEVCHCQPDVLTLVYS